MKHAAHPDAVQIKIMLKRLSGEFLGTFILVFCGTGAIVIDQESAGVITHVGIAMTFGLIVMAMILSFGHISGAHINPAVTIALCVSGRFKKEMILPYVFAQLAGALLASYILKYLFPSSEFLGSSLPKGPAMQSCILECILSFILMLVILTSTRKKDHSLLIPAIAVGATVALEAMFAGPICGASMNPVRSISPALVSGHLEFLWIYIVGPVSGMLLAVLAFAIIDNEPLI